MFWFDWILLVLLKGRACSPTPITHFSPFHWSLRMANEIERKGLGEGGLGIKGKMIEGLVVWFLWGLWAGAPANAPQRGSKQQHNPSFSCLFISLFRFCWRNETKAKKKKRDEMGMKSNWRKVEFSLIWWNVFGGVALLFFGVGYERSTAPRQLAQRED